LSANNDAANANSRRKRAVILDDLDNTRVLKMLMFADKGMLEE